MTMAEDARDLIEAQERFIVRLRAALLTMGMKAEEITRITQDHDESPDRLRTWNQIVSRAVADTEALMSAMERFGSPE